MSDADDQMGGRGAGPDTAGPGAGTPPETEGDDKVKQDEEVDESSQESFPASDPPSTY